MKKIAFWSYKGGTGRTLTLCNVAVELMRKGKNVGIIDLDLEAPGIHLLFSLDEEQIKARGSFTDLLVSRTIGNLTKYVYEANGLVSYPPLRGRLFILPSVNLPEIDEVKFDDDTFDFVNDVFDNFIQVYTLDHLVIDTRTGFSVIGGLASTFADANFICLRPDRQNVAGVKEAVKAYRLKEARFHVVFSGVPRIEGAEEKVREVEQVLGISGDVTIPLAAELILDEKLYSLSQPDHEICRGYRKIADIIGRDQ